MRWTPPALIAIARRIARLHGAHPDEALPVIGTADRQLRFVYVRGVGKVRA